MTVLVTGALGWLGKRLTRLLAQGDYNCLFGEKPELRCLILPGQDGGELFAMGPRVAVMEGDLRRQADCDRFFEDTRGALVIHTAGIVHPRRVVDFYQGAVYLLAAARKGRMFR